MQQTLLAKRSQRVAFPANLDPQDRPALSQWVSTDLPPATLSSIEDLEAHGSGLLFQAGMTRMECWANEESRHHWLYRHGRLKLTVTRPLGRRSVTERPTLWITDNWSGGYFHWIAEALCRLEMAAMVCDLSEHTLILPAKYRRRPFVAETLEMFDLGEIRYLGEFERIRCARMTLPSHVAPSGNFREEILDRLRDRILQHISHRSDALAVEPQRIYLSRAKAGRRRIANESELLPILRDHGFKVVAPEDLDWPTQMRCIAGASCLISNHGAALTSMIAMQPGASVLEMRQRQGSTPNCFLTLASALRLGFHYQMVDAVDPKKSVYRGDMRVDPQTFAQTLAGMESARAA